MIYSELQTEVKRRCARDQGGTQFDTAIKTCINTSLLRLAREAAWRPLRRKTTFNTIADYSEGSGAGTFTDESTAVTVTGATFITDGIQIGRYIKLSGDGQYNKIATITGETTLTLQRAYSGTTTSTGTYEILGQEEYNLPIQVGHSMFLWHDEYGFPLRMEYATDIDFYKNITDVYSQNIPTIYRMWGEDNIISQLKAASVLSIASSSTSDTSISITVFGVVSGYPDYETIVTNGTNGTTAVAGSKSFTTIERVIKSASSVGRITVTGNTGNTTVAVLPVGNTTESIRYKKVQLWPLPNTVFPMNVQYYKEPYLLVNDGDAHDLGPNFDEALILLSSAKIRLDNNQEEADKYFTLYKDELLNLRKTNTDKIDFFPTMKRPFQNGNVFPGRGLLYAQAGPWFGPSSRF